MHRTSSCIADPSLRAIRTGILKSQITKKPSPRVGRGLARKLFRKAIEQNDYIWAACAHFCFCLLLRVPSEFFLQFRRELVVIDHRGLRYGPIHRKGKLEKQYVRAFCTCSGDKFMCWHPWLPILSDLPAEGPVGVFTVRNEFFCSTNAPLSHRVGCARRC